MHPSFYIVRVPRKKRTSVTNLCHQVPRTTTWSRLLRARRALPLTRSWNGRHCCMTTANIPHSMEFASLQKPQDSLHEGENHDNNYYDKVFNGLFCCSQDYLVPHRGLRLRLLHLLYVHAGWLLFAIQQKCQCWSQLPQQSQVSTSHLLQSESIQVCNFNLRIRVLKIISYESCWEHVSEPKKFLVCLLAFPIHNLAYWDLLSQVIAEVLLVFTSLAQVWQTFKVFISSQLILYAAPPFDDYQGSPLCEF